jgi:DMSO/TMAO reductase YedYZ molybdopterin-dependent catalytic subunit
VRFKKWDRRTVFGVVALFVVLCALISGLWWASLGNGAFYFADFNLLNWHIALGFVLSVAIIVHMLARAKRLRTRDIVGRRRALHLGSILVGGVALWPLQEFAQKTLHLPGAQRRFTGSYEANSYQGNIFPTSSWVADQPKPIDPETWQLTLGGALAYPRAFSYAELTGFQDELEATLDCTGGFYSTQRWQGVSIGTLLDQAELDKNVQAISFISVTSYRWSLPLAEARHALLATRLNAEALSHEHGFPIRLVAPGHRGFEWVKWIIRVEALTEPDAGQVASIFTSSFTDAGRGK